MDIWTTVRDHLNLILPVGIPILFLVSEYVLKAFLEQADIDSVGADMAKAGSVLYIGTTSRVIYLEEMAAPGDILTAGVFIAISLAFWALCVWLSFKKFPVGKGHTAQPRISAVLGTLALGVCCYLTLRVWG